MIPTKRSTLLALLTLFLVAAAAAPSALAVDWNSFYSNWIQHRLELGLRSTYFEYRDPTRSTVDGDGRVFGYTYGVSINGLEEEQDYVPLPYLVYKFTPYVAMQLGWETLEGRSTTQYDHSDGHLVMSGPSLLLLGRWSNDTRLTPYAGLGLAYLYGDFEENSDWYAGGLRMIEADDATAFLMALGCSTELAPHVDLDIQWRLLQGEAGAKYYYNRNFSRGWDFPIDSWQLSVGLKYLF